jgi:hypothetical protein
MQKGFSTLFLLVALAVIGAGGYWYWNETEDKAPILPATQSYENKSFGFGFTIETDITVKEYYTESSAPDGRHLKLYIHHASGPEGGEIVGIIFVNQQFESDGGSDDRSSPVALTVAGQQVQASLLEMPRPERTYKLLIAYLQKGEDHYTLLLPYATESEQRLSDSIIESFYF